MTTGWNIVFVVLMIVIFWAILSPTSQEYWQDVGPTWHQMLQTPPVD